MVGYFVKFLHIAFIFSSNIFRHLIFLYRSPIFGSLILCVLHGLWFPLFYVLLPLYLLLLDAHPFKPLRSDTFFNSQQNQKNTRNKICTAQAVHLYSDRKKERLAEIFVFPLLFYSFYSIIKKLQTSNRLYSQEDLTIIENFRGFKEIELSELKPITLISGKNNTGKSSILEGIFLFLDHISPDCFSKINYFRGTTIPNNSEQPCSFL